MIQYKNVRGSLSMIDEITQEKYIDFNVDTVYVRTNIRQDEDSTNLYVYDELQMTYDEYSIYKDSIIIEDFNKLKTKLTEIDKQVNVVFDYENCSLSELKQYQINLFKLNLENYLKTNPIRSSCHGDLDKYYSISYDKQSYLSQMILITQLALQNGIVYQPSWNATGEECTYDWTIDELQQLAFEIENVVRPLISKQQKVETLINACETKDELLAIDITFGDSV